jgi:O-antigen/teichoic acid export membrane protein
MSLFRSTGVYTIANGVIAVVGLGLTVALGRQLGPEGFGVWASFFAAQNIWAGLGFMRLETRLATCTSIYQANRIIFAGFFVGILASITLSMILLFVMGSASNIWLAVLSGFGLSLFDALSQRNAFVGQQLAVLGMRCVRTLLPLMVALVAALVDASVTDIIVWHGGVVIIVSLLVWRRWLAPARWWRLSVDVVRRYRHGLLPSIIMSLLNGLWINGLTPALNHFATSALAGQFAMVQRLVGGALGLLSTAISLGMLKRDFVEVHWQTVRKVLTMNVIISLIICLLMAIPLMSGAGRWLGVGWTVSQSMYYAACAFLVSSFAIGAISILAVRLHDEWFLAFWQFSALLCWLVIYAMMPPGEFVIPALWVGSGMYVLLGLRWRALATAREKND